jgi:putative ABC transport system permease protein
MAIITGEGYALFSPLPIAPIVYSPFSYKLMFILARYSYRNLWVRRLTTLLTAGGMGLVVFVFSAVLMLATGLEKTLIATGSKDNAVFIRRSSETEVQSIIDREQAQILETLPEIDTARDGRKLAAPELVVLIGLKKRDGHGVGNVLVRGVKPEISALLRPQVHISEGRFFRPGALEIVIGKNIAQRFVAGGLGEKVNFGMRSWTIVGIMDAGGTGFDSEVWGDVDLMMGAFHRYTYSSLIARLREPSALGGLQDRVLKDPRLTEEARRETEYYQAQSELMARFIRILGIALTLIFSLGAIIGSMVTMYSAVAARVAEIGTLRALGFQRGTILISFLLESVFLGLLGGIAGLGAASLMNRLTISTMNWQTFSELSFRFTLTRAIAADALAFAGIMGLLGGMLPALRASRLNIVDALRLQ